MQPDLHADIDIGPDTDTGARGSASATGAAKCWLAVASAEHVRRGRGEGFMQVCHGKAAPLRRLKPGDRVVYYSPTGQFGGRDRLQAFTALGVVRPGDPYAFDMGGGFVPWRRDVAWDTPVREAPIAPLLDSLSFTAGRRNWGYAFRFGLLQVTAGDMALIEAAMQPVASPPRCPAVRRAGASPRPLQAA